jgi:hypothetical protein
LGGCSHPFKLTLLKHAQQCHLSTGRNVANFVQKDRTAIYGFDAAEPPFSRTGECAFFAPEKLGSN